MGIGTAVFAEVLAAGVAVLVLPVLLVPGALPARAFYCEGPLVSTTGVVSAAALPFPLVLYLVFCLLPLSRGIVRWLPNTMAGLLPAQTCSYYGGSAGLGHRPSTGVSTSVGAMAGGTNSFGATSSTVVWAA